MTRNQVTALTATVATIALVAAGCGSDVSAPPRTERTPASSVAPNRPATAQASDPLAPVPADRMFFTADVLRADDGTAVVVSTNDLGTRAAYRLYDRRWQPLTPVLELPAGLSLDRSVDNGFVGYLFVPRRKPRPPAIEPVMLHRDGTLAIVDDRSGRDDPAVRPRPGDLRLSPPAGGLTVYRPATGEVRRSTVPSWDVGTGRIWDRTRAGDVCALAGRERIDAGAVIHASVDEGRTFTDLSTAALPSDSGPFVQSCETAADRVAVMTGGENPRWVHVLDRRTGRLLASHFVGDRHGPYNPYSWRLLPDGTLVFDTNRPGLYVATDTSDRVLEFRPHPRLSGAQTIVLGDDLALLSGTRHLYVSRDEGRTWVRVEL